MDDIAKKIPGLSLALMISLAALFLGKMFPIIGAAVFGIVIGIIIRNSMKMPEPTIPGIIFTSKKILQLSIILLGGTLSFGQIIKTGFASVYVMIFTIAAAFITAFVIGKALRIGSNLKSLIGVGTAICGGSAIVAISSIIDADDHEIAYAVSTIFLFNVIAVLLFPPLGHLLGLTDYGFGMFAGLAINDTSSVVAAGYTFSNAAGDYATIVKLTRTTFIIPVSILFVIYIYILKKKALESRYYYDVRKIFPWFILGFVGMAIINSSGIIHDSLVSAIKETAKFMIVMALSAIGLQTNFKKMMQTGYKPLLAGFCAWLAVAGTSLTVQFFTGQM
jgi:uncharacterized integral membrane protein (TIGR00698 family)